MILDIRTLLVVSVLLLTMLGLALLLTWRVNRGIPALRHWAVAYLLLAAGLLMAALRSPTPSPLELVANNALTGAGPAVLWLGIRSFLGQPYPWRAVAALYAAMLLGMLLFSAPWPDMAARVALGSGFCAIVTAASAADLLRAGRRSPRTAMGMTGGILAVHAAFYVGRAALALNSGALPPLLEPTAVQTLTFLEGPAMALAVGLGFVIMTTERLQADLRHVATYDSLTGVLNRRAFLDIAEAAFARLRRGGAPFSLLVMDIDHFKRINDSFGHQAGDAVLVAFTRSAQSALRTGDLFSRYGGEEFCALLPDTTGERAHAVAERLRAALSDLVVTHEGNMIATTVSIGIAEGNAGAESFDVIVAAADMALYRAKAEGRNRVVMHESARSKTGAR